MKSATVAGLLATVLYSQQAVATYDWNDAQRFPSPENADNQCSGDQTGGYDWGRVPTGKMGSFDGFDFSGFDCKDSFNVGNGRRGLTRRTQFTGKAIVGKATKDDASCPKIAGRDKDFSITQMHFSVDKDSDIDFEYDMPDGSVCKQKVRCSTQGTTVKNNQCGGAKQVKVKGDCNFGIHRIDFDCNPGQKPPTTSPTAGITATTPVCKPSETLTGGSCVPTPPSTTPATTTASCKQDEEFKDGKCSPRTPTGGATTPITTPATTTASCKENEEFKDGRCSPKTPTGGITTPTTTAATTCKENEDKNDKGSCVPKTTTSAITTPTTTAPTITTPATTTLASCKEGEEFKDGKCTPKTPTGGITTPTQCATSETQSGGQCVPLTSSSVSPSTASCGEGSTFSGSTCVKTPTGGITTSQPATSDLVTTEIVVTTLTTCPVTITSGTITQVTSTLSTTTITSTATFCPKCGDAPPTTIGSSTVDGNQPTPPTCGPNEELKDGKCVPKGPTGGVTTTSAAAPSCRPEEELKDGKCVPKGPAGGVTTTPAAPTCKPEEAFKDGKCIPNGPTSGVTTTSAAVPSCKPEEEPKDGKCVPRGPGGGITSTTPATPAPSATSFTSSPAVPSCKSDEELKDNKCVPKTPTGGQNPPATIPEAPCPQVLPRCLSTWIQKAKNGEGCSSNSDVSCFCPSPDFISSVQECVSAWATDDSVVQGALSYLVGICADFVPENPGICTGVPETITLIPTPQVTSPPLAPTGNNDAPKPTAPPAPAKDAPSTVITFTRTISSSAVTQTVTVPQVQFNTQTITITATAPGQEQTQGVGVGVGLVPALPLTTLENGGDKIQPTSTPVAGNTAASTFVPSSTTGGSKPSGTGNSPVSTFTGAASKPVLAVGAGLLGLVAFLA